MSDSLDFIRENGCQGIVVPCFPLSSDEMSLGDSGNHGFTIPTLSFPTAMSGGIDTSLMAIESNDVKKEGEYNGSRYSDDGERGRKRIKVDSRMLQPSTDRYHIYDPSVSFDRSSFTPPSSVKSSLSSSPIRYQNQQDQSHKENVRSSSGFDNNTHFYLHPIDSNPLTQMSIQPHSDESKSVLGLDSQEVDGIGETDNSSRNSRASSHPDSRISGQPDNVADNSNDSNDDTNGLKILPVIEVSQNGVNKCNASYYNGSNDNVPKPVQSNDEDDHDSIIEWLTIALDTTSSSYLQARQHGGSNYISSLKRKGMASITSTSDSDDSDSDDSMFSDDSSMEGTGTVVNLSSESRKG